MPTDFDYGGKQISLQDQYDLTAKTVEEAKNQFAELSTIVPKTSEEAEKLSDRIGIMNKGKLIELGTAKELIKKKKAKTFEDAFIKTIEEDN